MFIGRNFCYHPSNVGHFTFRNKEKVNDLRDIIIVRSEEFHICFTKR